MNKPCNKCELANSYKTPKGQTRYYPSMIKRCSYNCESYQKYQEFLDGRRQYQRGEQIKSVQEYLDLQQKGETLFYWNKAIRHYGWLNSMQFRCIVNAVNAGIIYRAVKKEIENVI